ncbi:MAG: lipopolysaccharide transport periplasmic protein LptA [Gammaproteobacteria bacterium]|nr:lipopolysaccharide transport periplasmic protein LptA [Gammaproteobacteria bacterium]
MSLLNTLKPNGSKPLSWILIALTCCLTSHAAIATSKSNEKATQTTLSNVNKNKAGNAKVKNFPVNISADQLISQTKGGQSEYRGNVVLERHKLRLQGNSLKIIHPGDKLQQAVMSGNPAKFKDYLPKKQQWVNGEAKNIVFQQDKDTITLTENAYIIMDNGNKIKADKIVIYNKDETFEAFGSKQTGRVKMTIQPEN